MAIVIGVLASIGSMASFVPQAVRVVRTRDTKGLSRNMYVLSVLTFALWAAYGVALGNWLIGVTNTVCFVLTAFILVMLSSARARRAAGHARRELKRRRRGVPWRR